MKFWQVASTYLRFGVRVLLTASRDAGEAVEEGLRKRSLREMCHRHVERLPQLIAAAGFPSSKAGW